MENSKIISMRRKYILLLLFYIIIVIVKFISGTIVINIITAENQDNSKKGIPPNVITFSLLLDKRLENINLVDIYILMMPTDPKFKPVPTHCSYNLDFSKYFCTFFAEDDALYYPEMKSGYEGEKRKYYIAPFSLKYYFGVNKDKASEFMNEELGIKNEDHIGNIFDGFQNKMENEDENLKEENEVDQNQTNSEKPKISIEDRLKKASLSICKIVDYGGTGILVNLPYNGSINKFILTNDHVIDKATIETIKHLRIFIKEGAEERNIDLTEKKRYIKTFPSEDFTIIQIVPEDNIDNKLFIKVDRSSDGIKGAGVFEGKEIAILLHPNLGNLRIQFGKIEEIDSRDRIFTHSAEVEPGSSGSPILSLSSCKLIGMYYQGNGVVSVNYGIFLDEIIKIINYGDSARAVQIKYPNGSRYVGEVNKNLREGKGVLYFAGGAKYEGMWKNNQMDGKGVFTFDNGEVYNGFFKNDKMTGKGTYKNKKGVYYVGDWENDQRNGNGYYYMPDGSKYLGEWKNDKRNGKGKYIDASGLVYDGEWKDNTPDGHGLLFATDGSKYFGDFKNGLKNGHGIFVRPDGLQYNGEWKNGLRDGQGITADKNGQKLSGLWKEGKAHGEGILTLPNGKKIGGIWKEGKLIEVKWFTQ